MGVVVVEPFSAHAQTYPSKSVRMIVNFPPGGTVDIMGRSIAQKLGDVFGQAVVVENRAGAGGNIGAEFVAKAPADGYTLLMTNGATLTINPHLQRTPFDPMKDFTVVTQVARIILFLAVHPSVPANTVAEFLAFARANPGKVTYGTAGNGSGPHIAGELLNRLAGISTVNVPYKGIQPAISDLVAGQTNYMFIDGGGYPYVQSGRLRTLATASGSRIRILPNLPTLAESGVPGYHYDSAHTLAVPAGTPREIVTRLSAEVTKILNLPDVTDRIRSMVAEVIANSVDDANADTREDFERGAKFIKEMGIRIE